MKDIPKSFSGWRYGAWGVIALFTALLIIRWQALPVFLDIYYHAASMTGFRDAGGIVLHDFWEYAPAGRPHLYPPVFHVILLGLNKLGLEPLFLMRLVSAAIYPLLLAAILWVVRKLYDDRLAFFTVLAASLPYTFFLNVITSVPSTIALIIFILLFYALETRRLFSGVLLLGLLFYTHAGLPWIAVFTLILYAAFRREGVRSVLTIISGGIMLGSPWLIYTIGKGNYFLAINSYINNYFEANILLYLLALIGAYAALKQKGPGLFYLAMLLGMAPMVKGYTFRFLCGEGLLPIIFLAGMGLEKSYQQAAAFLKRRARPVVYTVLLPWIIFYFVIVCSHSSSFWKFTHYDPEKATALETSVYLKKGMEKLFTVIREFTRPDEIIYCNYNYIAGMFYVFSGRVTSCGMLNEVKPAYPADAAMNSALIIWIKNPERVFDPGLRSLIDRLRLVKVAETELAYIYRNPVVTAHRIIAKPVIHAGPAFMILAAWVIVIFICITRRYPI